MAIETFTGSNTVISVINDIDVDGNPVWVDYSVGITAYMTNSMMQLQSNQTQNSVVRIPVRRSEQSIQFVIEWPLQTAHSNNKNEYNYNGFRMRNQFQNDIRKHHQYVVNSLKPAPMKFVYNNNSNGENIIINNNIPGARARQYNGPVPRTNQLQPISVQGWIGTVTKEYDRFKNVYTDQYIMNVLTPLASATASYSDLGDAGYNRIIPQANIVNQQGLDWASLVSSGTLGIDTSRIPG